MLHPARPSATRPSLAALICILAFGLAGAAALPAQQSPAIRWARSFDEAVREAIASDRPILVHFTNAAVAGEEEQSPGPLVNAKVVDLSRKFVCIVGSPDAHPADGKSRLCARFGSVECKEHQRNWTAASQAVSKSPRPTAPQFVFVRPDRSVLFRHVEAADADEVVSLMERALAWFKDPSGDTSLPDERLASLFEQANANRPTIRKPAIRELAGLDDPRVLTFLQQQTRPEAGEVKRQEAVKAMKDARNVNTLPIVIPLLFEPSGQLKRNAVFALRNLGLRECVPPMLECYSRETTNRMKALILRTVARLDQENENLRRIHRIAMNTSAPTLRIHALRACLDLDVNGELVDQVIEIAHAGTSLDVMAVACYVATELILKNRQAIVIEKETGGGTEKDAYARSVERPHAREILVLEPKLGRYLRELAEGFRDLALREYALECAKALDGEPSRFREDIRKFHDDKKDEVFKEY